MQKQKVVLPVSKWGTIKSKYLPESKYVSNDEFTVGSYNFITNDNGAIEKRPTDVQYNSTALSNAGRDQFEAIFANGVHHLLFMDGGSLKYTTGDGTVALAQAGYTATASNEYSMYQNRVYFGNGVDNPSVYDLTAAYGGVTYTPPQVKNMGAQAPVSAVTFAADSAAFQAVPIGGHTYKVTYLYYGLEESNGGTASILHTVVLGFQIVHLTAVPIGGYGVTARNIYRDNGDGNYLLVGTIEDNTTTTFTDSASAGTTPMPVSDNLPPIFSYIALNLSRLFVAGVPGTPTTLYWSLPGLPDIFDPDNFLICNPRDPITAVAVYQGTTYIFNRHSLGTITGLTDDTFAYQEFPGSVGCVDNRSIQIRTIDGVPVIVWLSDRGFYKCNGSTVEYISDPIEDLVNINIQQSSFVTGSNTQSTQADFAAGTASPSIDLNSNPGTITTIDPTATFQSQSDWEGGSLVNIATKDGSNSVKVPVAYVPTFAQGSIGGSSVISGSNLVLPTVTDNSFSSSIAPVPFDGTFYYGVPFILPGGNATSYAQKITVSAAGTISSLKTYQQANTDNGSGFSMDFVVTICSDSLGNPGSVLWNSGPFTKTQVSGTYNSQTFSPNLIVPAGTYWIVTAYSSGAIGPIHGFPISTAAVSDSHVGNAKVLFGASWISLASDARTASIWRTNNFNTVQQVGPAPVTIPFDMTFVQTAVSSSGTWQSSVYDSFSSVAIASAVINTGSYPTSCSGTLFVDASNDPTMSTGITTVNFSNANGSNSVSTTNLRYWRLRYSIATTDNRRTPSVTVPALTFNTTGTWISPAIDCTTDVTSYNALTVVQNLPAGTTATITAATSTDNVTYSSYGPIGSAAVHRYIKIKIVLTAITNDTTTPSISFLEVSWNLTATFTSSIINIGQVPSGWGVFQDQASTNGGTLTFYMRSAASSGAIGAATFHVVSNGAFPDPAIVPLQFSQWKIVFTSGPAAIPTVDSVTINWFLGNGQSPIRVASLFFNKTYFLAASELGQTTNNIVIVYDFEGNWRLFRGVTIASLSLFYNQPFYCDAVRKNIYQWLIAPTGSGSATMMDVRTKAFDLGDVNHLKIVRSARLTGLNTGTLFHVYYSVDRGATWTEMLNVDGMVGYQTSTSGSKFSQLFVPSFDEGQETSGSTIMFRVTSTDAFPATVMSLEPVLYVRNGLYLEEPI